MIHQHFESRDHVVKIRTNDYETGNINYLEFLL